MNPITLKRIRKVLIWLTVTDVVVYFLFVFDCNCLGEVYDLRRNIARWAYRIFYVLVVLLIIAFIIRPKSDKKQSKEATKKKRV